MHSHCFWVAAGDGVGQLERMEMPKRMKTRMMKMKMKIRRRMKMTTTVHMHLRQTILSMMSGGYLLKAIGCQQISLNLLTYLKCLTAARMHGLKAAALAITDIQSGNWSAFTAFMFWRSLCALPILHCHVPAATVGQMSQTRAIGALLVSNLHVTELCWEIPVSMGLACQARVIWVILSIARIYTENASNSSFVPGMLCQILLSDFASICWVPACEIDFAFCFGADRHVLERCMYEPPALLLFFRGPSS